MLKMGTSVLTRSGNIRTHSSWQSALTFMNMLMTNCRTRKSGPGNYFVDNYTGFFAFLISCRDTLPANPRIFFKIFATSNRPVSQAG